MATNNSWNSALPISISKGGIGLSSTSAYSIICSGTTSTSAYQNVSGVGTSGQVLTSNGSSALPTWQTLSGGVSGPGSTTNLAIATWNGTGGTALLNNSTTNISSGIYTNTAQPCFFAYSNNIANQTGDNTNVTLQATNSWFDQNSNFNTGTLVFTAPVTGKYMFCVSWVLYGGTGVSAQTAGSVLLVTTALTYQLSTFNYFTAASLSAGLVYTYGTFYIQMANMTAGDTARPQLNINAGVGVNTKNIGTYNASNDQAMSSFSGFLIC